MVGENVAHAGRFWMLNVSTSPSGSLAAGVNEYAWPAVTVVAGCPVIVGARFGGAVTWMENGASDAEALPSDTLITIFP